MDKGRLITLRQRLIRLKHLFLTAPRFAPAGCRWPRMPSGSSSPSRSQFFMVWAHSRRHFRRLRIPMTSRQRFAKPRVAIAATQKQVRPITRFATVKIFFQWHAPTPRMPASIRPCLSGACKGGRTPFQKGAGRRWMIWFFFRRIFPAW